MKKISLFCQKGFSVAELMLVMFFLSIFFVIFYNVLIDTVRENETTFKNDTTVSDGAIVFSKKFSRKLSSTLPSLVTIIPYKDEKATKYVVFPIPSDSDTASATSFSYPLSKFGYKNVIENPLDEGNPFENFGKWNKIIVYYYNRDDDAKGRKLGCLYEYRYNVTMEGTGVEPWFLQINSGIPNTQIEANMDEITSSPRNSFGIAAENLSGFKVSFDKYPAITVKTIFSYGQGGKSSEVNKLRRQNKAHMTQIFDLNFDVIPGR